MNKSLIIFLLLLFPAIMFSQMSPKVKILYDDGMYDYETKDYSSALINLQRAFRLDSENIKVMYGLALVNYELKDYKQTIYLCKRLLAKGISNEEEVFVLYGSSLDNLGKKNKAYKIFEKGLKKHPDNYLMLYNTALMYFNDKLYDKAFYYTKKSIEQNKYYAHSHFLLSDIMIKKGYRIRAMLPLYVYTLMTGKVGVDAYNNLINLWEAGPLLFKNTKINDDYFRKIQTALSKVEIKTIPKEKVNSTYGAKLQLFVYNTNELFNILSTNIIDKNNFWWKNYINLFVSVRNNNYNDVFCYYLSKCKYEKEANIWLSNNSTTFMDFSKWLESYDDK